MSAPFPRGPLEGRTLKDAIAEARHIIEAAISEYDPELIVPMFSGGNDSVVVLHLALPYLTGPKDGALHCDTTIGIPETKQHVYRVCHDWSVKLYEYRNPEMNYREFIHQFQGFPGPGFHFYPYVNLKERALEEFLRRNKTPRTRSAVLLYGSRASESERRMGNATYEIETKGMRVEVNPILHFTDDEMHQYRERFNLPVSEVAAHLHMSGECLCGAFAKPGEKEMIRFFYPDVAAYMDELEAEAREAKLRYCIWGVKRPGPKRRVGLMCNGCVGQAELFEDVPA